MDILLNQTVIFAFILALALLIERLLEVLKSVFCSKIIFNDSICFRSRNHRSIMPVGTIHRNGLKFGSTFFAPKETHGRQAGVISGILYRHFLVCIRIFGILQRIMSYTTHPIQDFKE